MPLLRNGPVLDALDMDASNDNSLEAHAFYN